MTEINDGNGDYFKINVKNIDKILKIKYFLGVP